MEPRLPDLSSRIETFRSNVAYEERDSVQLTEGVADLPFRFSSRELSFRMYARTVVTSGWFSSTILGVIVFNTVLIALQTDSELVFQFGYYFEVLDNILLGIYIWELALKLYALGFDRSRFFRLAVAGQVILRRYLLRRFF